jgi:hypothetical protein
LGGDFLSHVSSAMCGNKRYFFASLAPSLDKKFGTAPPSLMLEIDELAVDWVVGGMRRERREREGRDCVNSHFFKLNFNLFSKKLKISFVFPCLRIS